MAEGGESPLSEFEEKCCQEGERDNEEQRLLEDKEVEQRLWAAFQGAARAVTNLCRERLTRYPEAALWTPFQETSSAVSQLFREAEHVCRASSEMAHVRGYHQRNREILQWARKKRRHIHRDDLIGMLAGRIRPEHSAMSAACQCHVSPVDHLSCPLSASHLHSQPQVPFQVSGVSSNVVTPPTNALPSFPDSVPMRGENAGSRRRSGLEDLDESALWDSLLFTARKRPSSGDGHSGSPKRGRFV